MPSSGMLHHMALLRTDVSEERFASINSVTIFRRSVLRLLITANVVAALPILVTLMLELIRSSETSIVTRATRRYIPEGDILHSHRRQNIKS
jgi:hypothetical protein